ncbi:inverse autotransporter beta domain-containing protein, partial [Salmonella enterica]|nr:hypothetical protein [Salmonella enterica]EDF4610667.1 hypothetical protein [Salmonella enterica]EGJ1100057.1 hypothetical protein [Salmonella enterica]EGJ9064554.1 hypothetical protein [Salmonella enterica]EIR5472760.1 inverse autotransporter beta domain-containing protein [Salmonella enterica]
LFDTDHLQSNPRAVTTDLTWTPFPLMTVSAGRRQGQNSHFETEFGVNFTLNPDLTWQQQTDPAAVAAMRTLAGSRHVWGGDQFRTVLKRLLNALSPLVARPRDEWGDSGSFWRK